MCTHASSLVCKSVSTGGEVYLHDALELCFVAAVLEGRVVMVTAEHVGLVVRETGAVEPKVIAPLVVGVRLAHSEMCRQSCTHTEKALG